MNRRRRAIDDPLAGNIKKPRDDFFFFEDKEYDALIFGLQEDVVDQKELLDGMFLTPSKEQSPTPHPTPSIQDEMAQLYREFPIRPQRYMERLVEHIMEKKVPWIPFPKLLDCPFGCAGTFRFFSVLDRHISRVHKNRSSHCHNCNVLLNDHVELVDHMKGFKNEAHGREVFICCRCKRVHSSADRLVKDCWFVHENGAPPFQCPFRSCPRTFGDRFEVKKHLPVCIKKNRYGCNVPKLWEPEEKP